MQLGQGDSSTVLAYMWSGSILLVPSVTVYDVVQIGNWTCDCWIWKEIVWFFLWHFMFWCLKLFRQHYRILQMHTLILAWEVNGQQNSNNSKLKLTNYDSNLMWTDFRYIDNMLFKWQLPIFGSGFFNIRNWGLKQKMGYCCHLLFICLFRCFITLLLSIFPVFLDQIFSKWWCFRIWYLWSLYSAHCWALILMNTYFCKWDTEDQILDIYSLGGCGKDGFMCFCRL
jgi:hypothetical protein